MLSFFIDILQDIIWCLQLSCSYNCDQPFLVVERVLNNCTMTVLTLLNRTPILTIHLLLYILNYIFNKIGLLYIFFISNRPPFKHLNVLTLTFLMFKYYLSSSCRTFLGKLRSGELEVVEFPSVFAARRDSDPATPRLPESCPGRAVTHHHSSQHDGLPAPRTVSRSLEDFLSSG